MSCQRCKQSTNGPQAFLLTCQGCSKTWHHRCHMPPVEDGELMQRLRATNMGDMINGIGAWTCRRCKKADSATPSVASSRATTVSSESNDDRMSVTSNSTSSTVADAGSTASRVASTAKTHVRQEHDLSTGGPLTDSKKGNWRESTDTAPGQRILTAKRTKPKPPHIQPPAQLEHMDVQMRDITPTKPTPEETRERYPERSSSKTTSHLDTSAQNSVDIIPAALPEDDVEMRVDVPYPSRTSQGPSSDNQAGSKSAAQVPLVRAASLTHERELAVRSAVHQYQDAGEDDDPEDLYGPPVERRVIRILPSLAEELREQQRRSAAEKEKPWPLAPDWILARHVHDPLWKEVRTRVGGRRRRKPTARRLGENGLNVNELVGYLSIRNSVREHAKA